MILPPEPKSVTHGHVLSLSHSLRTLIVTDCELSYATLPETLACIEPIEPVSN